MWDGKPPVQVEAERDDELSPAELKRQQEWEDDMSSEPDCWDEVQGEAK